MYLSLKKNELADYVVRQVNNIFPDINVVKVSDISKIIDKSLERLEFCFDNLNKNLKYFKDYGASSFNHLNTDNYCMFLWFLSNEAYLDQNIVLAEKLFYLNKMLNGVDAFYSLKLPDIFLFVHPVGTVVGNASFKNYLVIYQNVTIGSNPEGVYPTFEEKTILYSNSAVIGACKCGENSVISSGARVIDCDIPKNSLIFTEGRNVISKDNKKNLISYYFDI